MADQANRPPESTETSESAGEQTQGPAPTGLTRWGQLVNRVVTRQLLASLLAFSLAGHAIGYAFHRLTANRMARPVTAEVPLGQFRFEAAPNQGDSIRQAEFSLHVALLPAVGRAARNRLATNQYRVRQSVEELVRSARGDDFEDPALRGLKMRLQEQINSAIALRAVSEVIITDLRLERAGEIGSAGQLGQVAETRHPHPP